MWQQFVGRQCSTSQLKCDETCAETRFCLSAKRKSPFKSAGASVQSTTGSRGVRISGRNAGYTMFRGSVKGTGYPLHSPVSPSLPLPASPCSITFQLDSTTVMGELCFLDLRDRLISHTTNIKMVGHRSKGTGPRDMDGPPKTNRPWSCYFVRVDGQEDKYRSNRRGRVCNMRIQVLQQNRCIKQEKIKY